MGHMSFLSLNQQCQDIEGMNTDPNLAWPWAWPHPFFIHHWTLTEGALRPLQCLSRSDNSTRNVPLMRTANVSVININSYQLIIQGEVITHHVTIILSKHSILALWLHITISSWCTMTEKKHKEEISRHDCTWITYIYNHKALAFISSGGKHLCIY